MAASAIPRRAAESRRDQKIERGVFEEIDAVGEQRHRADGNGDGELDAEISEVEEGDQKDGLAQGHVCSLACEGRSPAK
jgi:hypothetical protein